MSARTWVAVWLALVLAAVAATSMRAGERFDLEWLDRQFHFLRAHFPQPSRHDVVIVGIDQETTQQLHEPLALWHAHLGAFLRALTAGGAAVAGLDLVLPDRSYDKLLPGIDRALLVELVSARRSLPVVLGLTADPEGKARTVYPAFLAAAASAGFVLFPTDRDGLVRRFDERIDVGGQSAPTLAGQMARALGVQVGSGHINYAAGEKFSYVPLQQVLAWQAAGRRDELVRTFSGKPVLLGSVLRFDDRLAVPLNPAAWDAEPANAAGVTVHALALRNLLDGSLVAPLPAWALWLLCALAVAAGMAAHGVRAALAVAVGGTAAVGVASTWLLGRGWILPPTVALLALWTAAATRCAWDATRELREQRHLRKVFSAHVSPQILEQIMQNSAQPGLGGQRYRICVLFADIRGFTERSEGMTPEAALTLLNDYFNRVTACIHDAGGTVDKFLGDGIMAFFGAPQALENPCEPAFQAARDMLARLESLNRELEARGEPPIAIGVGLHAGEAVVGHVGSDTRHDYTAIGDTVNVASRLEGLTKDVNFPLVCSVTVIGALAGGAQFVALGERAIKGHRPVEVYGWRPAPAAVPAEANKGGS